jgi:hypothetical protein
MLYVVERERESARERASEREGRASKQAVAMASHLQTLSLELKMRAIAGVLNAAVFKACASIITEMLSTVFNVAACWRLTSDVLLRARGF